MAAIRATKAIEITTGMATVVYSQQTLALFQGMEVTPGESANPIATTMTHKAPKAPTEAKVIEIKTVNQTQMKRVRTTPKETPAMVEITLQITNKKSNISLKKYPTNKIPSPFSSMVMCKKNWKKKSPCWMNPQR